MSSKPKRLGRGIATLIPAHAENEDRSGEIQNVDINAIDTNPYQPRTDFDEEEIAGLAESIRNQGLLQPVVLRKKGDRYEIISGERRVRAFRHLKRDAVPGVVKTNISDKEMLELALVENIQREQLNEIEKAIAYRKLIDEFSYTHEALAAQVGKSRAAISNSLRLLNLPDEVMQMVRRNEISSGHARALLSLDDGVDLVEAAKKIVSDKLTVRDVETFAQQSKIVSADEGGSGDGDGAVGGGGIARTLGTAPPLDANLAAAIEKLQYKFGTSVRLKASGSGGNKGRVEIEYFSNEDLTRIFDLLLN